MRDLGGKRVTDSVGAFTSGASRPPRAEEISRFLHERGFRKELLACLTTPDLAKSPADPDRVLLAILAATDGAALFEAEDEPVLAKAQAQPEFPQVVGDMVATLRAKLVPQPKCDHLRGIRSLASRLPKCGGHARRELRRIGRASASDLLLACRPIPPEEHGRSIVKGLFAWRSRHEGVPLEAA